jgi:hypothetical protein
LVDLVDIRLFRGEMDVFADLVAYIAEKGIVDEVLDYGMLVAIALIRHVHGD